MSLQENSQAEEEDQNWARQRKVFPLIERWALEEKLPRVFVISKRQEG